MICESWHLVMHSSMLAALRPGPTANTLKANKDLWGGVFNLGWKLKCMGGSIYIHESHSFLNSLSRQELSIWNGLIGGTHFFKLCQGRWATVGSLKQEAAGSVS